MVSAISAGVPLTLVLAGGGAKGAAHAGVLQVLAQAGMRVGAMAGVSAGALVAALHGLGYSPGQIAAYIADTHLLEVWELDPTRQALFGSTRVQARLRQLVGDRTFADLSLPVVMVAANLDTGEEARLTSGPLVPALCASMALPGLFAPQRVGGASLVDGGLVNPLPLDVGRALGGPLVAVDLLTGSFADRPDSPVPQLFETRGPLRYATEVARRVGLLDMLEVAHQATLITTHRLTHLSLETWPPDVLLRPAVRHVGLFAFDLADEAFAAGQAAAQAALPQLLALAAVPAHAPP